MTGRSGQLGDVWFIESDYWPLNTVLWVKEFRTARPLWAYHYLQFVDLKALNAGSAVPTLNRNHVHRQPAVIPPASAVSAFERLTHALFARRRLNREESMILKAARDELLPRLLSPGGGT